MKPDRPWEIYLLRDPRTGEPRYIGATSQPKIRLSQHLSHTTNGRTHRDCWIRSLAVLGLRPIYEVIERGMGSGWQEAERQWIALYRWRGNLTNATDGGEGRPGHIDSLETRTKQSAAHLGKKQKPRSAEHCAKLSAAKKGKPRGPFSAEHRAKISAARRGQRLRPMSPEHKAKLSISISRARREGIIRRKNL